MSRLVFVALAALCAPALAGETPYTGPGSNPATLAAMKTCEPMIDKASRRLVFLPQNDPARPQIVGELAQARTAMDNGNEALCEQHVHSAEALEH